MGKFVFVQMGDDRQNELKVSNELTWTELSEEFFSFLQGCGYVLTREQFADHWAQYLEDAAYDAAADECCGGGCCSPIDLSDVTIGDINLTTSYDTNGSAAFSTMASTLSNLGK